MTDLGATVRLTASNYDGDGNPADAGAGPTLTLTLPDGSPTALTSSVVHDTTGEWHADYVTVQAGRHVARWVGTGSDAFAYTEAFTVDPVDVGALFPLREARRVLGWPADEATNYDEEIRELSAAVTPVIEDLVGAILPVAVSDWFDGGGQAVVLTRTPVLAVTSVSESWGAGTTRTLTAQVLDGGGPFDAYGYTIDLATGLLTRRVSGVAASFPAGRRNIHVAWTCGQALMPNVKRAAKEQLRFMWDSTFAGNRPGYVDSPQTPVEYTPAGYAVPNFVAQLCAGQRRIPGIA